MSQSNLHPSGNPHAQYLNSKLTVAPLPSSRISSASLGGHSLPVAKKRKSTTRLSATMLSRHKKDEKIVPPV